MTRYGMVIDTKKCIGCHVCAMACKTENNLPNDVWWNRIFTDNGGEMGYTDEDFDRAKAVQERNGKYYKALYDQAGNSIAVPIFESIFRKIILHEVA